MKPPRGFFERLRVTERPVNSVRCGKCGREIKTSSDLDHAAISKALGSTILCFDCAIQRLRGHRPVTTSPRVRPPIGLRILLFLLLSAIGYLATICVLRILGYPV